MHFWVQPEKLSTPWLRSTPAAPSFAQTCPLFATPDPPNLCVFAMHTQSSELDRHHSQFLIIKDNTSSLMKPVSGLSMELRCEECNWQRARGLFPVYIPTLKCGPEWRNVANGRECRGRESRSEVILGKGSWNGRWTESERGWGREELGWGGVFEFLKQMQWRFSKSDKILKKWRFEVVFPFERLAFYSSEGF